jgi:glutamate formiminotransferase / formiminotetrahydrofolate cyclodeaminase
MTRKLVECVPNFSEGRRPEVIEALAGAIVSVPGVYLLDRHIDPSHNRSVFTFVGAPEAVKDAAFRAIEKASQVIDLTKHEGVHPRIGATDVVPFVPLRSMTMADCVRLAETLGQEVAEKLGIPVYLYEHAARRPERKLLANIRRGEFETLVREIADKPERAPDFGPPRVHPTAGATAIGARTFLIAFNVNLASTDHAFAKTIAAKIREAGGGFEGVRALGLSLEREGFVQVSMNLTDYNQTGLIEVYKRVEDLAREQGVAVKSSEVVGLVPKAAVFAAARDALKILKFDSQQVVEERLADLGAGLDLAGFLDDVSSTTPAPGGGSAAALAGALAAASAEKVVNLTRAKKKFRDSTTDFDALGRALHAARWDLIRLAERDAAAFDSVIAASRLPRATPEEIARRTEALQAATLEACRSPLATAESAAAIVRDAAIAGEKGNRHAIADAVAAIAMARGAMDAAWAMFRVNVPALTDTASSGELRAKFQALRDAAQDAATRMELIFEAETAKMGA